ncbi:hypothetical protein ACWDUL_38400 [Nocardia niigatensis]
MTTGLHRSAQTAIGAEVPAPARPPAPVPATFTDLAEALSRFTEGLTAVEFVARCDNRDRSIRGLPVYIDRVEMIRRDLWTLHTDLVDAFGPEQVPVGPAAVTISTTAVPGEDTSLTWASTAAVGQQAVRADAVGGPVRRDYLAARLPLCTPAIAVEIGIGIAGLHTALAAAERPEPHRWWIHGATRTLLGHSWTLANGSRGALATAHRYVHRHYQLPDLGPDAPDRMDFFTRYPLPGLVPPRPAPALAGGNGRAQLSQP